MKWSQRGRSGNCFINPLLSPSSFLSIIHSYPPPAPPSRVRLLARSASLSISCLSICLSTSLHLSRSLLSLCHMSILRSRYHVRADPADWHWGWKTSCGLFSLSLSRSLALSDSLTLSVSLCVSRRCRRQPLRSLQRSPSLSPKQTPTAPLCWREVRVSPSLSLSLSLSLYISLSVCVCVCVCVCACVYISLYLATRLAAIRYRELPVSRSSSSTQWNSKGVAVPWTGRARTAPQLRSAPVSLSVSLTTHVLLSRMSPHTPNATDALC